MEGPAEGDSDAGPDLPDRVDAEQEYSDEDQVATVTITEDFDPAAFVQAAQPVRTTTAPSSAPVAGGSKWMPASGQKSQLRMKKEREKQKAEKERSWSMETKAERKKGREMEARRRTKKAAIAIERDGKQRGGPSSRGRGASRG